MGKPQEAKKLLTGKERWTRHRYRTVLRTIMALESGAVTTVRLCGSHNSIIADLKAAGYLVEQRGQVSRLKMCYFWDVSHPPEPTQ